MGWEPQGHPLAPSKCQKLPKKCVGFTHSQYAHPTCTTVKKMQVYQTDRRNPKKSPGLETWTGLSTHIYKYHKNIQNVDLQLIYHMGQKSKHFDNHSSSYENPKHKRSFGQNLEHSNQHPINIHKIHNKSPKIMKSLPCIHNMPNYTFASFLSKIESSEGEVYLQDSLQPLVFSGDDLLQPPAVSNAGARTRGSPTS